MAAKHHFLSSYTMTSEVTAVWSALLDVPSWTAWWPWLKRVEVLREATAEDGVGSTHRLHVRAKTG